MQAKGTPRSSNERAQRALLALVLDEQPARVWVSDLEREFGPDTEAAIDTLVSVGLLSRIDTVVMPTIAARHFDWLELP